VSASPAYLRSVLVGSYKAFLETSSKQGSPRVQSLIINQKEVHLWSTSLVLSSTQESQLLALLSPDEVAKANRFYFPIHRHRYIVARGVLRCLLSRYLQHPPEQIVFSYLQHGKPYTTNIDLQFNISHSHDIAV
jgi:4'-phosphopantetheinyl transferase